MIGAKLLQLQSLHVSSRLAQQTHLKSLYIVPGMCAADPDLYMCWGLPITDA